MGGETPYPPGSVLAQSDVRYVGDPIAVVIASSRYIAEDAADLVVVDIEPRPPVLGLRKPRGQSELVHRETDSNIPASRCRCRRDPRSTRCSAGGPLFTRSISRSASDQRAHGAPRA